MSRPSTAQSSDYDDDDMSGYDFAAEDDGESRYTLETMESMGVSKLGPAVMASGTEDETDHGMAHRVLGDDFGSPIGGDNDDDDDDAAGSKKGRGGREETGRLLAQHGGPIPDDPGFSDEECGGLGSHTTGSGRDTASEGDLNQFQQYMKSVQKSFRSKKVFESGDDDMQSFAPTVIPALQRRQFRKMVLYPCVAIVLLVAVVVGAVFVTKSFVGKNKGGGDNNNNNSSGGSNEENNGSGEGAIGKLKDENAIFSIISDLSDPILFRTPGTAQHNALEWMKRHDASAFNLYTENELIQRYSLATLYFATGGKGRGEHGGWTDKFDWLSLDLHVCDWAANQITCAGNADAVAAGEGNPLTLIGLTLNGNNLVGEISPEIAALSDLELLDLSDNSISGPIPEGFSHLRSLSDLRLSNNVFSGEIMVDRLGKNPDKLEMLYLNGNQLSGSIPSNIQYLSSLKELNLSNNLLSGVLPIDSISSLSSLQQLHVENNLLSGFITQDACTKLSNLRYASADCAGITPLISCDCCDVCYPQDLSHTSDVNDQFDSLEKGDGKGGQLIEKMIDLALTIAMEVSTSTSEPTFNDAQSPHGLALSWLRSDDKFLAYEKSLTNTSSEGGGEDPAVTTTTNTVVPVRHEVQERYAMAAFYYLMGGTRPPSQKSSFLMSSSIGEEEEDIASSVAAPRGEDGTSSGQVVSASMNIEENKSINNNDQEYVVVGWKEATNWLSNIHLCEWDGILCGGGCELENYENCRVTEIQLVNNNLSGEKLPSDELIALENLEKIDLSQNHIGGTFPGYLINDLSKLSYISLGQNRLSGELIFEDTTNMDKISVFSLEDNMIQGKIPSEIGFMSSLLLLILWGNALSDSIPKEIGNLSDLYQMDLSHNNINGTIPIELGELTQLGELRLGQNNITGNIPNTFASFNELEHLDLSHNNLTNTNSDSTNDDGLETLAQITPLKSLKLNHNINFMGNIPNAFGNLERLQILSIEETGITGEVPKAVCKLSMLEEFSANCDGGDGESVQLLCDCCTHCNT